MDAPTVLTKERTLDILQNILTGMTILVKSDGNYSGLEMTFVLQL